jgi:hypothetical protein
MAIVIKLDIDEKTVSLHQLNLQWCFLNQYCFQYYSGGHPLWKGSLALLEISDYFGNVCQGTTYYLFKPKHKSLLGQVF